jgi:hypothetical protein
VCCQPNKDLEINICFIFLYTQPIEDSNDLLEMRVRDIRNPIANNIQAPGTPRYSVSLKDAIMPIMPPVSSGSVKFAKLSSMPSIGETEKMSNIPPSILTHRISILFFRKSATPNAPIRKANI